MTKERWISGVTAVAFLLVIFLTSRSIPESLTDPWELTNPRKIVQMIFALALIQMVGSCLVRIFEPRAGMVLTGFLAGFVSSTALTAALSKKSHHMTAKNITLESLSFLSATLAMLIQALILLIVGLNQIHTSLFLLFVAPIGMTILLIVIHSRELEGDPFTIKETALIDIAAILKLTVFIAGILALSNFLKNIFGHSGIEILTFLVSLFEIHGSIIANVQLHDAGTIDVHFLGELLTLSLVASYISKLVLVITLGNSFLKKRILLWSIFVLLSLLLSWLVFYFTT